MVQCNLGAPKKSKNYSAEWANRIYEGWDEDAPRATSFVLGNLGITRGEAVEFLRTGDFRWECVKKTRKLVIRLAYQEPNGLFATTDHMDHATFVEWLALNAKETYKHLVKRGC
jgi:hypothetical protein